MPLLTVRRGRTPAACPWCSLALIAFAGLALRGWLGREVSFADDAHPASFGSARGLEEVRSALGAVDPARDAPAAPRAARSPAASPAASPVAAETFDAPTGSHTKRAPLPAAHASAADAIPMTE